mmetsp:Transcript_19615/g.51009  ORF Transcript_19615/g.51009 Transcript_19615/m.51009 type:complete len:357 (+) Transcript_19615:66-1136(+)
MAGAVEAPLNGGLIGCGYFSSNHLHSWNEHVKGGSITCLCDTDEAKLMQRAAEFGIPEDKCYTSIKAMLDTEELDFCDVVTQPASHKPIVLEICAHPRQVHVICQKPMAPSVEDAAVMVEACKTRGTTLMIHENFRFQPPMRALKAAIEHADLGKFFWGRVTFRSGFDVYKDQPYLATDDRFIIYDLGVHALDVARFFLGNVASCYCRKQRVNPAIKGEDVATMLLGMASGASCIVDVSYASRLETERFPQTLVELEAERGSCRIDEDLGITIVMNQAAGRPRAVSKATVPLPSAPWMSGLGHLIQASVPPTLQHFVDSLRAGSEPETSGEDNLKTLALTMAAYESAESGMPVKLF